ncbi:IS3 family transposase [Pseudonocardia sp. H11422]|uniref:IS3 family transposase n=1 Tax=Pseudonocardia sp. H11422 TaxID=2835866 RepID=UPI0039775348
MGSFVVRNGVNEGGCISLVVEIFADSDETYGYRRVHAELGRRGVPAGPELVRAIMRDQGLQPCQPRPRRAGLTDNGGRALPIPGLVCQDFTTEAPGQKLVGDITYIPTWEGSLYLATVIDCHTKAVIGYGLRGGHVQDGCGPRRPQPEVGTGRRWGRPSGSVGGGTARRTTSRNCCTCLASRPGTSSPRSDSSSAARPVCPRR